MLEFTQRKVWNVFFLLTMLGTSLILSSCKTSEMAQFEKATEWASLACTVGVTVATWGAPIPDPCGPAFAMTSWAAEKLLLDEEVKPFKSAVTKSLEEEKKVTWKSPVRDNVKVDITPEKIVTPITQAAPKVPLSREIKEKSAPEKPTKLPVKPKIKLKKKQEMQKASTANTVAKKNKIVRKVCRTTRFVYHIGEDVTHKSAKYCLENGRWLEKT